MSKELSVSDLRLKYGSKWVVFTLHSGPDGLLDLNVNIPSAGLEKESFYRITREISRLVYSGVREKTSIVGKLKRMVQVDNSVLSYMTKLVMETLPLKG